MASEKTSTAREAYDVASVDGGGATEELEGVRNGQGNLESNGALWQPGAKLGRYNLLRVLGRGGMGEVYEALDPQLVRKVAIKVLRQQTHETETSDRTSTGLALIQEAQNLARLSHPNIVPIFDVGRLEEESVYLAMEFIPGQSLRSWLTTQKRVTWRTALEIMLQAGEGLAAAHAAGLLHLDFKPENVMMGADGRVRILDFGIALAAEHHLTADVHPTSSTARKDEERVSELPDPESYGNHREFTGTPSYMAPEQFFAVQLTSASDIFAFSCVLFETLTGRRPFCATDPRERLVEIQGTRLRWPRRVPGWLRSLIEKNLSYQPCDRDHSIQSLLETLRREQRRFESWRRKGVMISIAAAATISAVAWFKQPEVYVDPSCRHPEHFIDEVWNARTRESLAQGFRSTGLAIASVAALNNSKILDGWRDEWVKSTHELCQEIENQAATENRALSVQEQARACLNECLTELKTLVEIWHRPTKDQVLSSQGALASLTAPRLCTIPEYLQTRTPLPRDPHRRQAILANQDRIKSARIRIEQFDWISASKILEEVSAKNKQNFELLIAAEVAQAAASLRYFETGKSARSSGELSRAVLLAIAGDRPALVSRSLLDLWYGRIYRGNLREEGEERLGELRAINRRAGEPDELVAREERSVAIWRSMHGNFAQSMPHFNAALDHTKAAFGENSVRYAAALEDLGATSQFMGEPEAAIGYYERGLAIRQNILPAGHPERSRSHLRLATVFREFGDEYAAKLAILQGWRECVDAGLADAMCAELEGILMPITLVLGDLQGAQDLGIAFRRIEQELGARVEPSRPWTDQDLAMVLAERGELKVAQALANEALVRIKAERTVHPYALVEALMRTSDVELAMGNADAAARWIAEARIIADRPSEYTTYAQNQVRQGSARLAMTRHDYAAAIDIFQSALADSDEWRHPNLEHANLHREAAMALLREGALPQAQWHVHRGLSLMQSFVGIHEQLLVPFHAVAAEIEWRCGAFDAAWDQVQRAILAFDSVQVLETRRAPLDFLAAKILWEVDAGADSRQLALEFANRAEHEWLQWEGKNAVPLAEIRQWKNTHGAAS